MKSLIALHALITTLFLSSCTGTTDVPDDKENTPLSAPTTSGVFAFPDYRAIFVMNMGDNTISVISDTTVTGTLKLNNVTYPRSLDLGWINDKTVFLLTAPGVDLTLDNVMGNPPKGLVMKLNGNNGATLAYKRLDAPNSNAISVNGEIWTTQMKEDGTVLILDGMDLHIKDSIKVGKFPSEIIQVNSHVFVSNMGSNNLTVIDANTKEVINTIPVGSEPGEMAFIPVPLKNMNKLAVACKKSRLVSIIDLETLSLEYPIKPGFQPGALAGTHSQGGELFIVDNESNTVARYDVDYNAENRSHSGYNTGKVNSGVAYDALYDQLYISHPLENTVSMYSRYEKRLTINVGKNPGRMFMFKFY